MADMRVKKNMKSLQKNKNRTSKIPTWSLAVIQTRGSSTALGDAFNMLQVLTLQADFFL